MSDQLSRDEAKQLHEKYRKHRNGIRLETRMATICLICGSVHVHPKGDPALGEFECRNCRVTFLRYSCCVCGSTIDSRDPMNPACRECGGRSCTCGACNCTPS